MEHKVPQSMTQGYTKFMEISISNFLVKLCAKTL